MGKYILIAVAMVAVVVVFLAGTKARAAETRPLLTMSNDERTDWFWQIIEQSRSSDQEKQLATLRAELSKLTPGEIETFGALFDEQLADTYSWDLWGAAYVIMGGASDDSFEYFRVWLISQGRGFFEAAKVNPDNLATLIPDRFVDVPEFELLAYVASDVWARKTGKESNAMPTQPDMIYSREPTGVPFDETAEDLAARYPLLWARFSEAPLG